VGYLSGILLKAIEVGDIEERLAAMEAVVGQSQRTGLAGDFDRPLPGEDGDHEDDSDELQGGRGMTTRKRLDKAARD
jgi:hypothetical protein